ncbi:hypothetical protein KR009_005666 [Drosophila setifemur]|nr:hypothetical protein KR009_005666 [Drosophila setifemur]
MTALSIRTLLLPIVCAIIVSGTARGAAISSEANSELELKLELELLQGRAQKVAQCRQLCYRESLPGVLTPPFLCRSRPECYMCHDYCRVLLAVQPSLASSMCADREFCTRGCRVACSYHQLWTNPREEDKNEEADASANAVLKE